MQLNIYRRTNQIGSSLIVIESPLTKIIIDVGIDCTTDIKGYDAQAVHKLVNDCNAILMLPYYTDHMQLAYNSYDGTPVYINETSHKMICAANGFRNRPTAIPVSFLYNNTPIQIGDFTVTPYRYQSLIYNDYMLLIEYNGQNILYTRDNRHIDCKQDIFKKKIDTLIYDSRLQPENSGTIKSEKQLERVATQAFKKNNGPIFVLLSATNINRIKSFYSSAKKTQRLFLQELYMAEITSALNDTVPNPKTYGDVKVFATRVYGDYRYELFEAYSEESKVSKSTVASSKFVMGVRPSMYNYIKSLCQTLNYPRGLMVYSLSNGYRCQQDIQSFLDNCSELGLRIMPLEINYNYSIKHIKQLLQKITPRHIMVLTKPCFELFSEKKYNINYKLSLI